MKKLTAEIDLHEEVSAMADFISQTWTPIQGLEQLFAEIRDAAMWDARAWADRYEVFRCASQLVENREALLAPVTTTMSDYDSVCQFLNDVRFQLGEVLDIARRIDGEWDYSRRVAQLYLPLSSKYPELSKTRPHGWDALAEGYSDFDGQEDYDPRADRERFKGTFIETSGAPDFAGRVALPYVMYDEKCQGRKAGRVLVGAVYTQFLGIAEKLNTLKVCEDLQRIKLLTSPHLEFEAVLGSRNPLVSVLEVLARPPQTRADLEKAEVSRKEFSALSEEEKRTRQAQIREKVMRMLSAHSDPDEESNRVQREEHVLNLLWNAFGTNRG
jgi:hypothetical protein